MRIATSALVLALTLAACGGGATPASLNTEGNTALGSGQYSTAAEHFEAALAAIGSDTSHDQYLRARMGLIEATVHLDAEKAKNDFLDLAKSSNSVGAKEYSKIGGMLANAGAFNPAIELVDAGIQAYPETPQLQKIIEQIKTQATQSGDSSALKALEGLGYL